MRDFTATGLADETGMGLSVFMEWKKQVDNQSETIGGLRLNR
jgi:hypothetical protein